jgi:hypothetical protein
VLILLPEIPYTYLVEIFLYCNTGLIDFYDFNSGTLLYVLSTLIICLGSLVDNSKVFIL